MWGEILNFATFASGEKIAGICGLDNYKSDGLYIGTLNDSKFYLNLAGESTNKRIESIRASK